MISRTSLLAGIEELKESPWYNLGKMDPNKIRHEYMEAMMHYGYLQRKEAVEIIEDICIKKEPAVLADSGWISIDDKLPPTDKPVLIYVCNIKEMTVASLNYDGAGFSNDDYWFNIKNIHHWRPLPEPPKEDKNDN